MKIKATYRSKANRRSVLVEGVTFVNGHSIIADLSPTGLAIINKATADGWFTIEKEWDKDGNIIVPGNATKNTVIEKAPVVEETPAVEETPVVEEPSVEEAPVDEDAGNEEDAPVPNLSDMTKAELLAYAEENGYEVASSMTKAEIMAVIEG